MKSLSMKFDRRAIQLIVVSFNLFGMLFYYSPLSLVGYWSDALFLGLLSVGSFFLIKRIDNRWLFTILKGVFTANLLIVFFNSLSLFNGFVSVRRIPVGKMGNNKTYGYFIERGNLGLTNGCYGEIQYHRQIICLPFLEFNYETDECSEMDYESIVKGS